MRQRNEESFDDFRGIKLFKFEKFFQHALELEIGGLRLLAVLYVCTFSK